MQRDYYEILCVRRDSSYAEIKAAYRELAKKYHPDVCELMPQSAAEEQFKLLSEAYEVLTDPDKKFIYDKYGHEGLKGVFGTKGFDWDKFTRVKDVEDIFGKEKFDDFLRSRRKAARGSDIKLDLEISLEEAAYGCKKTVKSPCVRLCRFCKGTGSKDFVVKSCTYCDGTGQVKKVQPYGAAQIFTIDSCANCDGYGKLIANPCEHCKGKGTLLSMETMNINIPHGTIDGETICISNKGEEGEGGFGDLYITIHIMQHPVFEKDGFDIKSECGISFTTAALGGEVQVETLWGKRKIMIPAGTQPGTKFRLYNEGFPIKKRSRRGDHYVTVHIKKVPAKLTRLQRRLLEEFAVASGEKRMRKRCFFTKKTI